MATLETVERLRERFNISYEEAKAALDASNDDLLDAVILLEQQGKVKAPQNGGYYSGKGEENQGEQRQQQQQQNYQQQQQNGENFNQTMGRFFAWFGKLIAKGNANVFQVEQNGKLLFSLPITALVLLLLFCFWLIIPLLIVGLFCGMKYRFQGPNLQEDAQVNRVMDSASKAAENYKQDSSEQTKSEE